MWVLGDMICLDRDAAIPMDPRALDAMMPYPVSSYGSASGSGNIRGRASMPPTSEAKRQAAGTIGQKHEWSVTS